MFIKMNLLTSLNVSTSLWNSLIKLSISLDRGLFATLLLPSFICFYLRMLKDPPATTLFVLDIRSETLSTDPSLDEDSLRKLLDVSRVCSFTEVLKN